MKHLLPILIFLTACTQHEPALEDYTSHPLTSRAREANFEAWQDWVDREELGWVVDLDNDAPLAISNGRDMRDVALDAVISSRRVSFGKMDPWYWQASYETLRLKSGVCIDMAIFSYVLLLKAGCDPQIIRVACWYLSTGIGHAELVMYFDGAWHLVHGIDWAEIPCPPAMSFTLWDLEFY